MSKVYKTIIYIIIVGINISILYYLFISPTMTNDIAMLQMANSNISYIQYDFLKTFTRIIGVISTILLIWLIYPQLKELYKTIKTKIKEYKNK